MTENKKKDEYRCSFVNLSSNFDEEIPIHHLDDQNSSFDRKVDISMDLSHSMNMVNISSNNIHNPQFNLSVIKEHFEDLPLQITSYEKMKIKSVIPHLVVDDKGDKKD